MRISYTCAHCGEFIDVFEVSEAEKDRLEINCLTENTPKDIIKIDNSKQIIYVESLCSDCIESTWMNYTNI